MARPFLVSARWPQSDPLLQRSRACSNIDKYRCKASLRTAAEDSVQAASKGYAKPSRLASPNPIAPLGGANKIPCSTARIPCSKVRISLFLKREFHGKPTTLQDITPHSSGYLLARSCHCPLISLLSREFANPVPRSRQTEKRVTVGSDFSEYPLSSVPLHRRNPADLRGSRGEILKYQENRRLGGGG